MSITLPPYPWGTFADDSTEFKVTQGQLRAELLKSLADNAALCERVRVLEDALIRLCSAVKSRGLVSTVKALAQADKALDARAALEQKP